MWEIVVCWIKQENSIHKTAKKKYKLHKTNSPWYQHTTTKFHILAASATKVETVLQPGPRIISFVGGSRIKSNRALVPKPGSHWKAKLTVSISVIMKAD